MQNFSNGLARYLPIAAYAIIGDCHTAALVSTDGSIDWYCPTRFDAPAVFCRLLDAEKGGFQSITPVGAYAVSRQYRGLSAVLETTFSTVGGTARLTDLMPIYRRQPGREGEEVGTAHRIVRLVEGIAGRVELDVRFKPTFDYDRASTAVDAVPGAGAVAHADRNYLTLACPGISLARDNTGVLVGHLNVSAGERRWVTLAYTYAADQAWAALSLASHEEHLTSTLRFWETWAAVCTYHGPYDAAVRRSALTLKLLTDEPTGAIVAAPTTSLPEVVGGVRNWDYRYSWLRDAALVLYALMTVGYDAEAADFFHWLEQIGGREAGWLPAIVYTVDGSSPPVEVSLAHLDGYCHSRPVRIGNAAARQRQLDIFGEVLSAANLYYRSLHDAGGLRLRTSGEGGVAPPAGTWTLLSDLVEQAAHHWQQPDHGVWEIRGRPRDFLYSKLMCWVALDRGICLAEDFHLPAPLGRWRQTRDVIRRTILERGFHATLGAFTQSFDSANLDASVLAIPQVGFLPATDPRVLSTIDRIRAQLTHDGLVHRYLADDELPGQEAAFALSTFWLVDALALSGQLDAAHDLFERVVGYANDVGLLSEEINPPTGDLLGNFPQGFTHLALIQSAVNLAKVAKHGVEEQAETEAQRAWRACRAAAEGATARPPRPRVQ